MSHRALSIQIKPLSHRSALPQCTRYGASAISLHQRLKALRDPGVSSLLVYPRQFVKFELHRDAINFGISVRGRGRRSATEQKKLHLFTYCTIGFRNSWEHMHIHHHRGACRSGELRMWEATCAGRPSPELCVTPHTQRARTPKNVNLFFINTGY